MELPLPLQLSPFGCLVRSATPDRRFDGIAARVFKSETDEEIKEGVGEVMCSNLKFRSSALLELKFRETKPLAPKWAQGSIMKGAALGHPPGTQVATDRRTDRQETLKGSQIRLELSDGS